MQQEEIDARHAELAKITGSEADVAALRKHLSEVMEGTAFKGSPRSARFLSYIVNQAIEGRLEALKERALGVELFNRSPSYDTGEDAIVRVTASDVRKRLLQHYGQNHSGSRFRISLPLGSYIPDITRSASQLGGQAEKLHSTSAAAGSAVTGVDAPKQGKFVVDAVQSRPSSTTIVLFSISALILGAGLVLFAFLRRDSSRPQNAASLVLPWSEFFRSPHPVQLITSDPNIAEIQAFTGGEISVSDYANRNYLAGPNKLSPDLESLCRNVLRGDKSSTIDTQIAVAIAAMAPGNSRPIDVHGARDIQISDLKSDNNFIFLGSPRSDPWVSLFSNQLDFRFVFDPRVQSEYIANARPRANELAKYVPTSPGWTTGESFAVIALLQNPDQDGQILLLAGANAEGTKAAGKLVTDTARLSDVLRQCGIAPRGPFRPFELLLHLNTMAGSPSNTDVVACHILPANTRP
jgi:hypothetical protein